MIAVNVNIDYALIKRRFKKTQLIQLIKVFKRMRCRESRLKYCATVDSSM